MVHKQLGKRVRVRPRCRRGCRRETEEWEERVEKDRDRKERANALPGSGRPKVGAWTSERKGGKKEGPRSGGNCRPGSW